MALEAPGSQINMGEYTVYILFSDKLKRYYVGQTGNFGNRLEHHNKGSNKYTSKGLPWKFIYKIPVDNRSEAIILENKIKKRGISRYLNDINFFGM